MLNQAYLAEIIKKSSLLPEEELAKHSQEAQAKKVTLEAYLLEGKILSEEQLYKSAADFFKIPFIDLKTALVRKDVLYAIPEPLAQTHRIIAFEKTPEEIKLAVLDPTDLQTFEFIEKKVGLKTTIYLTTPDGLGEILKQYHKSLQAEFADINRKIEDDLPAQAGENKENLKELAEDLPVIRIVDTLLEYAIFEKASDIHIEPTEKETLIRYRVDGILRQVMTLPKTVHSGIIARIKVLSNLKLDEHRQPQDGRFKIVLENQRISFRVSVIPVFDGEKIVIRLLPDTALLTLEQLGFRPKNLEIVSRNIKKPHGTVLVTGPTGSGKTTTLYAILNIINQPKVNICTIEDPIEYRMAGINQSQVSPKIGYTFATALRAFLRQDPNVIMVGEIRDTETAEMAVHSALTGHLVLSTLHTNDAVTAIPRLLDMGVLPFLVASTINLIVAQRLTRKICSNCKQEYTLDAKMIHELETQFNIPKIIEMLKKEEVIPADIKSLASLTFYRGTGCRQCNNEGYKGRMGIYEILEITDPIVKLILTRAPSQELLIEARKEGMITLAEDGFIKAKNGVTSLEEVLRVTKE